MTGGELIRSLGGWAASKKLHLKGQDRLKGDERILVDSDFVTSILAEANEKLDRYYEIYRFLGSRQTIDIAEKMS